MKWPQLTLRLSKPKAGLSWNAVLYFRSPSDKQILVSDNKNIIRPKGIFRILCFLKVICGSNRGSSWKKTMCAVSLHSFENALTLHGYRFFMGPVRKWSNFLQLVMLSWSVHYWRWLQNASSLGGRTKQEYPGCRGDAWMWIRTSVSLIPLISLVEIISKSNRDSE